MILFPAIDLKGGACVRLVRGEMATATVFNNDPGAQARHFAGVGFAWLHVVDLDGSFAGEARNGEAVRMIRRAVPDMRMQLGAGIRDRAAIDRWLDLGIDRVALGTAALRDPDLVRQAAADYPGRIIVDIGVRSGRVAVQGWGEVTEIGALEVGAALHRVSASPRSSTPMSAATVRWAASMRRRLLPLRGWPGCR